MKKLLTTLSIFIFSIFTLSSQVTSDIKLLPVKENMWIYDVEIYPDYADCDLFGLTTGQYQLLAIPTMIVNMGEGPAVYGYPGDGFITDYGCAGSYGIPNLIQFQLRDYCSGNVVAGRPKSVFALADNVRLLYWNNYTQRYSWFYLPSVREALFEEHFITDSQALALARAPYFSDTTELDLQYNSVGAADYYGCREPGNAININGISSGFYMVDVLLSPPSIYEGTDNNGEGYWSNKYSFLIYLDKENYSVYWGDNLPPTLPVCCDVSNPDPVAINADIISHDISWDSTGGCDFTDLKRQIVCEKRNQIDQQFDDITIPITTETSWTDNSALNERDLQRYGRRIPSAYNGGKFVYRYRIGNTVSKKVVY